MNYASLLKLIGPMAVIASIGSVISGVIAAHLLPNSPNIWLLPVLVVYCVVGSAIMMGLLWNDFGLVETFLVGACMVIFLVCFTGLFVSWQSPVVLVIRIAAGAVALYYLATNIPLSAKGHMNAANR